jgi:hypothetical protein
MAEAREWAVDLIVTTEHNYVVLARTVEEAIDIAEGRYNDGDEGDVVAVSIDSSDAQSGSTEYAHPENLEYEEEEIVFEP